jgi:hypothetical protein
MRRNTALPHANEGLAVFGYSKIELVRTRVRPVRKVNLIFSHLFFNSPGMDISKTSLDLGS